jgi:integrase
MRVRFSPGTELFYIGKKTSQNVIEIGGCSDYVLTMPSITKDSRERSPYWICCYTSANGQRLKKSTKVRIKPLKGEKRKDGSAKTTADKRSEAWEVCLAFDRAEGHAKNGTLTEQTAKKIIGEILERTSGEKLHDHTAGDWFDEWCAGKADTKSAATAERYRQVAREFLASLGSRAKLSLGHIIPKDIRTFRDVELAAGKSPKTANLSVKIVSAAFNAAFRQGYIPSNPCTALESLAEETAERSAFTPAQVANLVSAAEGDWKGAILLAYYTGARLRDVANMRWSAVDLKRQLVTFTPSKTKKTVEIPLHAELERRLLKSPGIGKAFLFPSLAGRGTGGKSGLSGQFSAIMTQVGIAGKITRHTAGGRNNSSLSFHSLRHSFNSAMANAGVSQEIRMKLTGHSSAEMNKGYTHHELEPLRAAIAAIPAVQQKREVA